MINYKLLFCCILAIMLRTSSFAQNTLGETEDLGRIAITAYVPQQIEKMPDIARNMLTNKLNQIATENGLGGSAPNSNFIITANIVVMSKDLTETAPPMTVFNLEVTLYIGDGRLGTKFANTTVNVKGVGTNENKAYIEALKSIRPKDKAIQDFVAAGKTKIIEYYNYKCDIIIQEAKTLASQNKYEEAIYKLTSVPEVCKDCFEKCMTAVGPIYRQYMDRQCRVKLLEAKNMWAASQDRRGADEAAGILSTIDPDAPCFNEAMALTGSIGKKIQELEKRDWDFKMKVFDSSVSLEKQRIGAYRDVGVAYGNHQPQSISYNVKGWW